MSKWLNLFLENEIVNRSDKSDRFKFEPNMSPLSLRPLGLLDEKMEKVENNHSKGGDKSARFRFEPNMSPLSLHPRELLDEKMVNIPEPDGFTIETNMSDSSLLDSFEERLAIAEYDGQQTHLQAQRIAYLDAFISILSTLAEKDPHQDWLAQKIQTALTVLETKNFQALN
jgi:hypothetical protein